MSPRPVSLSDEQLTLVREAAHSLPVDWRERFLNLVADYLQCVDITDTLVSEAVRHVLERMQFDALCARCGGER